MPVPKRYQIGPSLCGAISAGAYSAGVLDFSSRALDEREDAAAGGGSELRARRVWLGVMASASAGAITAALGVAALGGIADGGPLAAATADGRGQRSKFYLAKLCETRVEGSPLERRQIPRPAVHDADEPSSAFYVSTLVDGSAEAGWAARGRAALSSAPFPIGLAPRIIATGVTT